MFDMYSFSQQFPYRQTGFFSKIILDYLDHSKQLAPFFLHSPDIRGIENAIEHRKKTITNRKLLFDTLQLQYASVDKSPATEKNLELLLSPDTFTICTAHQPNIFTGHLYFVYKILHTIKIADHLNSTIATNNFVPVYYIGSEDADLEELGHIYIKGQKYSWETKQKGAVGKMNVDDDLINLIEQVSGQLSILPGGNDLIDLIKRCYTKDTTIQEATFKLVNYLFKDYGLIILIPDNAALKREMLPVFEDDILNNTPSAVVNATSKKLSEHYKVQAHPREINLFYFKDDIRNRLIKKKNLYYVEYTDIKFTEEEIKSELHNHPERFSPNVILRGLYQETILPNLVFVGGGGELAYWLELKELFQHYNIPFPVLLLRNSFMLIDKKIKSIYKKLKFNTEDLFKPENILINELVNNHTKHQLYLSLEKQQIEEVYDEISKVVKEIDITLRDHTEALRTKAIDKLNALEKKMLKAEKRKFEVQLAQIKKLRSFLFPLGELQERIENFMPYYARYGKEFINILYQNSLVFEQKFSVLIEEE